MAREIGVSGMRLYERSFSTFAQQAREVIRIDRLDQVIVEPVLARVRRRRRSRTR